MYQTSSPPVTTMTVTTSRKLNEIKRDVCIAYATVYGIDGPSTKSIKMLEPTADMRTRKGWLSIEQILNGKIQSGQVSTGWGEDDEVVVDEPATDETWAGFDIIAAYTRADAVEDGEQFNLTELYPQEAREMRFPWAIYCDREFYYTMIKEPAANDKTCNDEKGIVWDIFGQMHRRIMGGDRNAQDHLFITIVTGVDLAPAYKQDKMPHYILKVEIQSHDIDKDEPVLMLSVPEQQPAWREHYDRYSRRGRRAA